MPNQSKISYTPGPWVARKASDKEICVEFVDKGNRSIVAHLHDAWVCEEHGTMEANARLIAAAPQLVAACLAYKRKWFDKAENQDDLTDEAKNIIAVLKEAGLE